MDQALLFTLLAVFPFGRLLGHWPLDIVVGFAFLYTLFSKRKKSIAFKAFAGFALAAAFSYLVSVFILPASALATGSLYLFRLIAYWFLLDFCVNLTAKNPKVKPLIFKSLIVILVALAVFGWIQYFWWPDLTALKYLGWDDHLYRLVGSFLDPGFTSLFLGLGAVLSLGTGLALPGFFVISLAFTYSRAGYLAFLAAMAFLVGKTKKAILAILLLGVVVFCLPRPAGQGVNLLRAYSISSRLQNYVETLKIAGQSPVFGVGFNNICFYKGDATSHSCSGADSSLLLILATTGIVGLLIFAYSVRKLFKTIKRGVYFDVFVASVLALGVHSLFVNSLFYPFTMAFFAILISLQTFKGKSKALK